MPCNWDYHLEGQDYFEEVNRILNSGIMKNYMPSVYTQMLKVVTYIQPRIQKRGCFVKHITIQKFIH